jgi:hypothetical protein
MDDLLKITVGALVGGLATFTYGLVRTQLDDRRRRASVATALLAEERRIAVAMDTFLQRGSQGVAVAHRQIGHPVHQRFVDYIQIFRPETVQVVIVFSEEVERFASCLAKATEETLPSETEHLKLHARDILSAYQYSKSSLLHEGARIVSFNTEPN